MSAAMDRKNSNSYDSIESLTVLSSLGSGATTNWAASPSSTFTPREIVALTPAQPSTSVQSPTPSQLGKWRLQSPTALRKRIEELGADKYIIKGMLPSRSIALLLGDSGLGKSPLMYQAAICVAAGIPFLGRPTTKGTVIICDFENGLVDMADLVERISRYVGLEEPPTEGLYLWSQNDASPQYGQYPHRLVDMVREVQPTLVIIDSLASHQPDAEEKNVAATTLLNEFRRVMRDSGSTFVLVHHRRKQPRKRDEGAGPLESAILSIWFQDARGASALVNASDIRLGVDVPDVVSSNKDDVALVLRGFGRVRGSIGPMYLSRDHDENGDPAGYRALVGAELLVDPARQKALADLPEAFRFKDAKRVYGKGDQPTTNFLHDCMNLGLLEKTGRGKYQKVVPTMPHDGANGESA
jgi:hypothetical protein